MCLSRQAKPAQAVVKIGAVQSMTGAFSNTGRETIDGARLYLRQHGDLVAGKNIELVLKDDTSLPDVGKRLAQELIVNDKVAVLLGGITPSALSIVPLTTEAKTPMIVLVSGSSITVERAPTTAPSPTVTPGPTKQRAAIHECDPMTIGL